MKADKLSEQIAQTIRRHSDERLLEMIEAPDGEYTPEALAVAHEELRERGGASYVAQRVQEAPESPDPLVADYPRGDLQASSLNGWGTAFYGRRDEEAGGWYVTTKWIVAAHLPLKPLGSFRVRVLEVDDGSFGKTRRLEGNAVPLNDAQVTNVYMAAYGGVIGAIVALVVLAKVLG